MRLARRFARLELAAGALAGLVAGVPFALAMLQDPRAAEVTGLLGVNASGAGLALHFALAAVVGAGFGALHNHDSRGYAAAITLGVVLGLLAWVLGPLTLRPLLDGVGPTWSIGEASAFFPSLIGHLMFGGLAGLGLHLLLMLAHRLVAPEARQPPARKPPGRIVILGGGFGGMSAAQRLEEIVPRDGAVEVTVVSQSNFLLFTPMLAEVASSSLEAPHISAPIRAACPHTRFRHALVEGIDSAAQVVYARRAGARTAETMPYDQLLIALGAVPNFYELPGLADHAFALKTLEDAVRLRSHVIGLLERADVETDAAMRRRMLTFVVAGGGFAGTETIAEIRDLVRSVRRYYPDLNHQDMRFILVHSRDRILPELSAELGEYARRKLEARGVEFVLGRRVAAAGRDEVRLSDDTTIPTNTLVWTAGNQPHPLLRGLLCEHARSGQVVTDASLRVRGLDNVWAVGDAAQIPDPGADGSYCPPTAQHAQRQGRLAAENMLAALTGGRPRDFRFRSFGSLVALGHRTAAAEIAGRKFSGLLAWVMWRSIYLSKLPGLERKVRVALDWTIDLFFARDIVLPSGVSGDAAPSRRTEGGEHAVAAPEPRAGAERP